MRGYRAATSNLDKQIPLIGLDFPEIANCFKGSINVKLDCGLRVDNPDHRTQPIDWGDPNPEVFGLHRVSIEFGPDGLVFPAWLYIPYNSPHFTNRYQVEIIAEKIPGIGYGSRCQLNISNGKWESANLVVI